MLIVTYPKEAARELAAAVVTRAGVHPGRVGPRDRVHILQIGGGWRTTTWREDLRAYVDRGTVSAIGARTVPGEPPLTVHQWAEFAGDVAARAGRSQWRWIAVLTTPNTMLLLAERGRRQWSSAARRKP